MFRLQAETDSNAKSFLKTLPDSASDASKTLAKREKNKQLTFAYQLTVSLQAWRELIIEKQYSAEAGNLFRETQNDALLSIALASFGCWRSSLQSLRSCVEGALSSVYYQDHPIELRLWTAGKHRLSFSDFLQYFGMHPDLTPTVIQINIVKRLRKELHLLSRAVHAPQFNFRMTKATFPAIFEPSTPNLNMWLKRFSSAILAINLLLAGIHRAQLSGTQNRNLRKCISLAINSNMHKVINDCWKIHLLS